MKWQLVSSCPADLKIGMLGQVVFGATTIFLSVEVTAGEAVRDVTVRDKVLSILRSFSPVSRSLCALHHC